MADPHDDLPESPRVPRPDVAMTAVPPVPVAAAPPSFDAGIGARDDANPRPAAGDNVSERDAATITTLQRRADDLAAEHHQGSDLLAFAAAAAASLAEAARLAGAGVERARAPERTDDRASDAERSRLDAAALANQAVRTSIDADSPAANPVYEDELAAMGDDVATGRHDPSGTSDPFDAYLPEDDLSMGRGAGGEPGHDEGRGPGLDSALDPAAMMLDDGTRQSLGLDPGHAPGTRGTGPAEVGIAHDGATPWNGQTSIGTISHVDGDRAEQYAGRGSWTSFSITKDLGGVTPPLGQSVQINGDGTMQATPEQQLAQSHTVELERGRALT